MKEQIREELENLVLAIGSQVTFDYKEKNGIYEGMSYKNKTSLDYTYENISKIIDTYDEDKEELEKIISRNGVLVQDGWGDDPADLIEELMKWKNESQQL